MHGKFRGYIDAQIRSVAMVVRTSGNVTGCDPSLTLWVLHVASPSDVYRRSYSRLEPLSVCQKDQLSGVGFRSDCRTVQSSHPNSYEPCDMAPDKHGGRCLVRLGCIFQSVFSQEPEVAARLISSAKIDS